MLVLGLPQRLTWQKNLFTCQKSATGEGDTQFPLHIWRSQDFLLLPIPDDNFNFDLVLGKSYQFTIKGALVFGQPVCITIIQVHTQFAAFIEKGKPTSNQLDGQGDLTFVSQG